MTAVSRVGSAESEAVQEIQRLERQFDLLQYQVDSWCLWPLLRFDAAMAIASLPFSSKERFSRLEQLLIALRDLPRLIGLGHRKLVVKTYSSARLVEENGRKKDIFFDDLLEGVAGVLRIEGVNSRKMFEERGLARTPADFTSLPLDLTAGILSLLPGLAPDYSDLASKMSAALADNPRLARFTSKKILRKARFFYWGMKLYGWLLERTRPERVLTADPGEYLICAAARRMGIPVVEFQHGIASPDYNSFYSWTEYALPYKKNMPVPDAICLYGRYWQEKLRAAGFWQDELRLTGNILLDSFYRRTREKKSTACNILLTSQGLDRENLAAMIRQFGKQASEAHNFDYHLFIKMHPIYDREKTFFSDSLDALSSVTILEANEAPSTFELLSNADLHWSISSACHYDALGMGVPTVILGLNTHEGVLPLFENGYAQLARDGQELFEISRNWRNFSVPDETREYFYRSGALENARKEIGLL